MSSRYRARVYLPVSMLSYLDRIVRLIAIHSLVNSSITLGGDMTKLCDLSNYESAWTCDNGALLLDCPVAHSIQQISLVDFKTPRFSNPRYNALFMVIIESNLWIFFKVFYDYHLWPQGSRQPWDGVCLGPIVFFQKVWKEKSWIFYMKLRKWFW